MYYYLTEVRGLEVNMIGLDLKADVIDKCNKAAQKYHYDKLRFELGISMDTRHHSMSIWS